MMLNETEDTTKELRNVDNTNTITNTQSCNVAVKSSRRLSLVERLHNKMHLYLRETICLLVLILLSIVLAGLHSS